MIADDPTTPGDIEAHQILQTFVHDVSSVVDVYADGEKITTTDDHPFWVKDKGWVKAKDLQASDKLQNDKEEVVTVDRIEHKDGAFKVYNFEVQGFHTYFVSNLDVLVHNTCGGGKFLNPEDFSQLPDIGTIDPNTIRFSQDSIKGRFKAPYENSTFSETAKLIKEGSLDLGEIRIVEKDGKIYTLDKTIRFS